MFKFIAPVVILVIGRCFDIYTTFLYTPDLKYESNIIVKIFGANWTVVFIFQVLMLSMVVYLFYYYQFKFKPVTFEEAGLTLKQYISVFHFNNKNSFWETFYKIPKNKNGFLGATGFVAFYTLLVASYVVGTSTTLLLLSNDYRQLYKYGGTGVLILFITCLGLFITIQFIRREYFRNRIIRK